MKARLAWSLFICWNSAFAAMNLGEHCWFLSGFFVGMAVVGLFGLYETIRSHR